MSKYLSQEWLDNLKALCQDLPAKTGSARIQYQTTGGPEGAYEYYWVLDGGRLTEAKLGTLPDADATLAMTYEDAAKVQKGELDANAAFMQGKVKVTGNVAKMMALMPITSSPQWKALQEKLREVTEY